MRFLRKKAIEKNILYTQSIACAFGLAAAAPRSPYRHLELCGIANKITDYSKIAASRCLKGYDGMTKILFVCHGRICRNL